MGMKIKKTVPKYRPRILTGTISRIPATATVPPIPPPIPAIPIPIIATAISCAVPTTTMPTMIMTVAARQMYRRPTRSDTWPAKGATAANARLWTKGSHDLIANPPIAS